MSPALRGGSCTSRRAPRATPPGFSSLHRRTRKPRGSPDRAAARGRPQKGHRRMAAPAASTSPSATTHSSSAPAATSPTGSGTPRSAARPRRRRTALTAESSVGPLRFRCAGGAGLRTDLTSLPITVELSTYLRTGADGWSFAIASVRNWYAHTMPPGEAERLGAATAEVRQALAGAFGVTTLPPDAGGAAARPARLPPGPGAAHRMRLDATGLRGRTRPNPRRTPRTRPPADHQGGRLAARVRAPSGDPRARVGRAEPPRAAARSAPLSGPSDHMIKDTKRRIQFRPMIM